MDSTHSNQVADTRLEGSLQHRVLDAGPPNGPPNLIAPVRIALRSAPANRRRTQRVPPTPAILTRLAIGGQSLLISALAPACAGGAPIIRVRWLAPLEADLLPTERRAFDAAVLRVGEAMRQRFHSTPVVEVEP